MHDETLDGARTLYHVTTEAAADAIQRQGFRDSDIDIGDVRVTGVRLADAPFDPNDPARTPEWVLALDVPNAWLDEYEAVENSRGYRQWCIPAAKLDTLPIATVAEACS